MPHGIAYTKEQLTEAVQASLCWADVMRYFGVRVTGGNHSNFKLRCQQFEVDTSHFIGSKANQPNRRRWNKKSPEQIFVLGSPNDSPPKRSQLRRALMEVGVKEVCVECGQPPVWRGKPLVIQVDHVNGRRWDNRRQNLQFMCPNCHTQTETFGSLNK